MKRAYVIAAALAAFAVGVPAAGAEPAVPTITGPSSPANDNNPVLTGTADAASVVAIYIGDCSGSPIGTTTADGTGVFQLQVTVADDTSTTFRATATVGPDVSPCSAPFTYVEATPPDTTIIGSPPALTDATASFSFTGDDGAGSGIAGFECQLDANPLESCTNPVTYGGLDDGSHTFSVRARDAAGNVDSTPATHTWQVDATAPPSPVITLAPSNPSGDATPRFEFSDLDPSAGFRCALDGGAFVDCSSGAFTAPALSNGGHTFGVEAVDPAGNTSRVTSYAWTVDTVSSLVTFTEKPPLLTNQTSATFGFSASKPGSSFQCALDSAPFSACSSPKVYSRLGNGSHTVAIRAIRLGLIGPPSRYTWTVDLVPPQTTIATAPPAESGSAAATFAFSGSEQATFTCRLDGAGPTPCTSPRTYAGLGDGTHTFAVQAVDRAGNADPTPAAYSWHIAGVGPPTQDLRPPANVGRVKRNVGYRVLKLAWRRPRDADFDHVAVFVSTKRGAAPRTLVYSGKKQSYVNRRFKNGLYSRYLVVSYDTSDNASGGSSATVPPSALLRSPRDGQVVRAAPLLRWTPVRKATFYNVQLFYRGRKVLSAWPLHARHTMKRRWTYSGRAHGLRKGTYSWFVWPGFGPLAKSRYGSLLGQGTFRVR